MDRVDVFNLALSAIGTRNRVSSPTENSSEAKECLLWYDVVRRQALAAAPFQEARSNARLALQAERVAEVWDSSLPDPGWQFAYSCPSDMLRPRYLATYQPFILTTSEGNEKRIATNAQEAILIYTKDQPNIDMWSPGLLNAIVYGLGAAVCMKLTGKDDRMRTAVQMANLQLTEARVTLGNTDDYQIESIPPWLAARGVAAVDTATRYYYPFGPMFVGGPIG